MTLMDNIPDNVDCHSVNTFLAVGLASFGNLVQAIGYVIEKKAHINVNDHNHKVSISYRDLSYHKYDPSSELSAESNLSNISSMTSKSFVTSKTWCCGFLIYFFGSVIAGAALKFGPQSVIACFGSLTMCGNAILAHYYLKEPFGCNDIIGTLFIVIGSILAVIFGPPSDCSDPTIEDLEQNYIKKEFLIFMLSLTGITIIDFIATKYLEHSNHKNEQKLIINNQNSSLISESESATQQMSKHKKLFLIISYSYIAAYFGSINVLLMKSSAILIFTFGEKYNEYIFNWFFYVNFLAVIVVNILLEYFRQRALKHFNAIIVIPIYQVLLLIGSILIGATFYNEFDHLESSQIGLFVLSIIIILVGIVMMALNFGNDTKSNWKS